MVSEERGRLRVSDAERHQVAEVLREAAAEGRITLDELDERLEAAFNAKTYADLEPITSDLPGSPGAPTGPVPVVLDNRPVDRVHPEDVMIVRSDGDSIVRKGRWQVPRRVEVRNKYGSTRLDFREADIPHGRIEVHLEISWGGADVILPERATAEVDVDTSWFGGMKVDADAIPRPPAPHFVITGTCHGGNLRVGHRRPFSWSDLFG
ncbi:DUF1707 domain-containing protein [Nocardiopsis sp. N85]|uniref:DUF1707 SHOCT-like domain-containing protein n=1 Tax=Nocardiopsis sp. N85 TaxID=3029400 RepID=UPI00237EF297|nr:DUF1707 domain-containing protein [Nocardiopsis sp. N85]MDE3719825.1 DUF1707 domain-containing protein [Nocardiopsis sp. N85]